MKKTNFLDITLDLTKDIYEPYRKSNATTSFINSQSNHPTHTEKVLLILVNSRINGLSKNKEVFDKSKLIYNQTLRDSGFKRSLNFELITKVEPRKRHRKRKIIYYNSTF